MFIVNMLRGKFCNGYPCVDIMNNFWYVLEWLHRDVIYLVVGNNQIIDYGKKRNNT